ncbi:hypothetical protein BJB45_07475 [Halomonas huangheensis]|uniref:Uncharacterized protein n=1 Tax=Halomonas huangheensis TaxID=1178482 RepID=W1N1E5_9GAMM|nr:hypothetical protein BJB45_07475 [Halomonas huangheensis]
MLPFAALFLLLAQFQGLGHLFLQSNTGDLLLVATGLITALPL